jgi:alpha-mannosidase
VEQGLYKLKANKQKELNTIKAESLAALVAYQSLLANSFVFNPSFLILPDLLNGNTPIFFP